MIPAGFAFAGEPANASVALVLKCQKELQVPKPSPREHGGLASGYCALQQGRLGR